MHADRRKTVEQVLRENAKESRLESLFRKDLVHLKEVNYDGYAANVQNWELVVQKWFSAEVFDNVTCVNTDELRNLQIVAAGAASPLKLAPHTLGTVLDGMVNDSEQLVPLARFESTSLQRSAMNKLIHRLVSTTLYNLDHTVSQRDGTIAADRYLVSVESVKALGSKIYDYYRHEFLDLEEYSDYVITRQHLYKLLVAKYPRMTELDYKLVLVYLERDFKKLVAEKELVKFGASVEQGDHEIAALKAAIFKLGNVNTALASRQHDLKAEIVRLGAKKQLAPAKALLQNYKKIDVNLARQTSQLQNLQALLDQINQQSLNKELVATLASSSQVLANLNKTTDLDQLQEVLDTMSDNVDESNKIGELLSSTTPQQLADDGEIDKELEDLVASAEKKNEQKQSAELRPEALAKTIIGVDDGSLKPVIGKTKTEAGKTEAGKTEAGKTEAGKTEAGKTEVGKTEVGKTEVGKTEVGKTEAGKTEVGKTEAGKTEVGKTEIGKTEAGKTEIGKTETGEIEDDEKKPVPA